MVDWRARRWPWPVPISIFVGIVIVLIVVALIGYFIGAWDSSLSPP